MVNKDASRDRKLGMDRVIDRRDFLNGVAVGAAGLTAAATMSGCAHMTAATNAAMGTSTGDNYPPTRMGLRGSHAGAYERAHDIRDGTFAAQMPRDTDGLYDLVVVGAGISGLSAAYFYRMAKPQARILIL